MLWFLDHLIVFLNCSHNCLLYFSFLCYNRLLYYIPSVIYMKIQSDCFLIYLFDITMKYATLNYICLYYLHCTVMKTTISRFLFRRFSRCTTRLFIVLNNCTVNDCQNKWHINIIPFISLKLAAMTVLKTKIKKKKKDRRDCMIVREATIRSKFKWSGFKQLKTTAPPTTMAKTHTTWSALHWERCRTLCDTKIYTV